MKKIIRYAKRHPGFSKVASLGFYTVRLGFRVFMTCETTTFVYDVLSICFVQTCSAWELMVNASINIKQIVLMLGQSVQVLLSVFLSSATDKSQRLGHATGYIIGTMLH